MKKHCHVVHATKRYETMYTNTQILSELTHAKIDAPFTHIWKKTKQETAYEEKMHTNHSLS